MTTPTHSTPLYCAENPRSEGISLRWLIGIAIAHAGVLAGFSLASTPSTMPSVVTMQVEVIPSETPAMAQETNEQPPAHKAFESTGTERPQKTRNKPVQRVTRMPPAEALSHQDSAPEPMPSPIQDSETSNAPHSAAPTATASTTTASMPTATTTAQPRFDADYLKNPTPTYPSISRRTGEEGKVILRVRVEADGRPGQIEIKTGSGFARLDQAAEDAVRRWKFVPARHGDEAVSAWVLVPIIFNLSS